MKTVRFTATLRRKGYPKHATEEMNDTVKYDETQTTATKAVDDYLLIIFRKI